MDSNNRFHEFLFARYNVRIKITNISTKDNRSTNVEFDTEFGNCRAVWVGAEPILGYSYDVEVDIPFILKWGYDIFPQQEQILQIKINEKSISLIGVLHSIEDNLASLNLKNNIILIETEGTPFVEGIFVELVVEKIVVYNSNT
jgi:hypothetical protein